MTREGPDSRTATTAAAQPLTALRKHNSLGFVAALFECYRDDRLVALVDGEADLEALAGYAPITMIDPPGGGGWFEGAPVLRTGDEPAQIVFTSGTQGKPKPIVISHRALSDASTRLNAVMKVDSSIREYVGVPVTFSFGLGRCRAVAQAGGRFFVPERGFDPLEIRDMLRAGEINALSAVPTLLRLLISGVDVLEGFGDRIKWLEIGSQYMSRSEKEQVKAIFPNAIIVQHYGLTEASRSTFLTISDTHGDALESVGRAFGDTEIRTRSDGRIQIRGPHLATGILANGALEALTDEDGWFTTGDNGRIEDGQLYFEGRADDIINCGGIKVDPGQIEQDVLAVLELDGGIAIARIADARRGDGFFVGVGPAVDHDPAEVERAVHQALARRHIAAGPSVKVQRVDAIPTTPTGKIRRSQLAELYLPAAPVESATREEQGGVRALYARTFNRRDIPDTANFQDLGGDSLNFVEMSIALEDELGELPRNWDMIPVEDLARLEKTSGQAPKTIETGIFLRALAITCIVAAHSGIHAVGGGTFLLFFLIGHNLARFKSTALVEGRVVSSLLGYTRTLLVPYAILAVLFMAYRREFYPDLMLLYTNLVALRLTQIFPFWFVQVLVQCLAITGLVFLVPQLRGLARREPWRFAFGTTAILVALWAVFPVIWDTDHLRNLVPQRYLALLWLGWCCFAADRTARRLAALALALVFAWLDSGISRNAAWIAIGPIAMLFLPTMRIEHRLRTAIQLVSSATFYIFALNGVIAWVLTLVFERLAGQPLNPLVFSLTMAACLGTYWIINRAQERLRGLRQHRRTRRLGALPGAA